jgi:hypothetical protein
MPNVSGVQRRQELEDRGFTKESTSAPVLFRGRKIQQDHMVKNKTEGFIARTGCFLSGVAKTAASPTSILDKDQRESTFIPAFQGEVSRDVIHEVTKTDAEKDAIRDQRERDWGYNPWSRSSIQEHINKPEIRSQLREDGHGNYFMVENRAINGSEAMNGKDAEGSLVIWVPGGNFSEARMKMYYQSTGDSETNGKPFTDPAQQLRAIRTYGASEGNINTAWDKKSGELAIELAKKRNAGKSEDDATFIDLEDEDTMKELKEEVDKRRGPVTIDVVNGQARIYDKSTPMDASMSSFLTGVAIPLEKDTVKSINRIHGKDMEYKPPLAGEKPFADPLPPGGKPPVPPPGGRPPAARPPGDVPRVEEVPGSSEASSE